MSALARENYTLIEWLFREIKHNTVPWNLFFNKRSGAVVMSPVSEGLGAAGVGSNLTQSSGISYFSLYTLFLKYLHQYWSWAGILWWSLFKS